MPIKLLLICLTINCFYVNTIVLSLVCAAFVDQDDSASGGNPQTMGLVRIEQFFYYFIYLLFYYLPFSSVILCLLQIIYYIIINYTKLTRQQACSFLLLVDTMSNSFFKLGIQVVYLCT